MKLYLTVMVCDSSSYPPSSSVIFTRIVYWPIELKGQEYPNGDVALTAAL
jgi:hypothetical protein